MALLVKTVEFCGGSTDQSSLASAVARSNTTLVTLPESSITFLSVTLFWHCRDDSAAAQSLTAVAQSVKIGLAAADTVTVTDTITNSGEHQTYEFSRDVTAYFTANWTGPAENVECGITLTGGATCNHAWKLLITYEYDNTSATQVRTVRLPIESTRSTLTTSYQSIGGTNQLDPITGGSTILPENAATPVCVFIELEANEAANAVTDFTLDLNIPSVTSITSIARYEQALNSACWSRVIWNLTSSVASFTTARQLEARVTGVTSRMEQLRGTMVVTYTFTASGTTREFASTKFAAFDDAGQGGGTAVADRKLDALDFFIPEPGTITMHKSAVFLNMNTSAGGNVVMRIGGQSDTTFAMVNPTTTCGQKTMALRFDSGGQAGSGLAVAAGRNTLITSWRAASADTVWNVSGYAIVNYTHDVPAGGIGSGTQTCHWGIAPYAADANVRQVTAARTPSLPSPYFLTAASIECAWMSSTPAVTGSITVEAQYETGEGPANQGLGFEPLYFGALLVDAENAITINWGRARKMFKRWTGDPDSERADIETARDWRISNPDSIWSNLGLWTTHHCVLFDVAGTVTGYAGDGSGIDVRILRDASGERVLSATTTTGGTYSAVWFDGTEELVAECEEDSSHTGRSAAALAVRQ